MLDIWQTDDNLSRHCSNGKPSHTYHTCVACRCLCGEADGGGDSGSFSALRRKCGTRLWHRCEFSGASKEISDASTFYHKCRTQTARCHCWTTPLHFLLALHSIHWYTKEYFLKSHFELVNRHQLWKIESRIQLICYFFFAYFVVRILIL